MKKKVQAPKKRAAGKKLFNFAWDEDMVNAWKKKAAQEKRTLTNFIEVVVSDYVSQERN